MNRHAAVALLSASLLLLGCGAPRYVNFVSPRRDFTCQIPWGWDVYVESHGRDYLGVTVTGPLEPAFFRGTPSLIIRWYRYGAVHRLPGAGVERYSSVGDFKRQMMREVYGPDAYTKAGSDQDQEHAVERGQELPEARRIRVGGTEGIDYVVYRTMGAPARATLGVVKDEAGRQVVRERHAYVLIPMARGFYVLIYPATRDGFEKYKTSFYHLVNTFRILRQVP